MKHLELFSRNMQTSDTTWENQDYDFLIRKNSVIWCFFYLINKLFVIKTGNL